MMQRKLPFVLVALLTCPASAQVYWIHAGLVGADVAHGQFDGTTLSVSVHSTVDAVAVYEGAGYTSGFTNMTIDLTTSFTGMTNAWGFTWGRFEGGSVDLQFDDGANFYQLAGPIAEILAKVDAAADGLTQLSGEGLFQAAIATLPPNPTGIWDQMAPALSSLSGLTFILEGIELPLDYDWTSSWGGRTEGPLVFLPLVPEPGSMMFLAMGGALVLPWRHSRPCVGVLYRRLYCQH